MPRGDLLQRHGLQQYEPIAYAMRTGEVGLLESTLEANQHRFIHEVPPDGPSISMGNVHTYLHIWWEAQLLVDRSRTGL